MQIPEASPDFDAGAWRQLYYFTSLAHPDLVLGSWRVSSRLFLVPLSSFPSIPPTKK